MKTRPVWPISERQATGSQRAPRAGGIPPLPAILEPPGARAPQWPEGACGSGPAPAPGQRLGARPAEGTKLAAWLGAVALLACTGLGLALSRPFVAPIGSTLRLRVVAASNSPSDQARKLAVRDAILPLLAPDLAGVRTAAGARQIVAAHLDQVQAVAQRTAGPATPVAVRLGTDSFPARRLGFLRFPAGSYDTLVVTLGPGRGHDWWTVLFPPFAFVRLTPSVAVMGPADGSGQPVKHSAAARTGRVTVIPAGSPKAAPVEIRFFFWDLWGRLSGGW